MNVLAIDTSGDTGSVAAWADGRVLAEREFSRPMNHGQELFPAIEALSRQVGWSACSPELIAVSAGPGSYTGLRVGIASAKMLSYAQDLPLVAVPTLDSLIRNVRPDTGRSAPVIDAKRGQVYVRWYEWSQGDWQPRSDLAVHAPQDAARGLPPGALVFGTGAERYADAFRGAGLQVSHDPKLSRSRAGVVAELGAALYAAGHRTDRDALIPIYLRKSEAEENKERAQGQQEG